MSKIGRKIAAYHPEIAVDRQGTIVVIQADLDDYYEDGEVLSKLAAANPQCRTMGELVEAIEKDGGIQSQRANGVISCRILECEASTQATSDSVRPWDEPI
jgi:hypothetical protein